MLPKHVRYQTALHPEGYIACYKRRILLYAKGGRLSIGIFIFFEKRRKKGARLPEKKIDNRGCARDNWDEIWKGRKPHMNILGIDLGGSRVKLAIVDAGRVKEMKIFPIRHDLPMRAVLRAIESEAMGMAGIGGCRGIGFAYPGIVDTRNKRVLCINDKYTDAAKIDFPRWARERFGLGLLLLNDAAAALCGEMAYGAGRGCDSAVLLMIGTGIGTAAFSEGRLLTGKHGAMGILGGHIAVAHEKPRRCTCGSVGCLEAYAGSWALPGLAREHPGFESSVLKNAERIDYRALAEGCEKGDPVCRDVLESACRALCAGAVSLSHAYDPDLLILSGGASRIQMLQTAIQAHLDRYAWTPGGRVTVKVAEDPEASVALGLSSLFEAKEKGENHALSEQL